MPPGSQRGIARWRPLQSWEGAVSPCWHRRRSEASSAAPGERGRSLVSGGARLVREGRSRRPESRRPAADRGRTGQLRIRSTAGAAVVAGVPGRARTEAEAGAWSDHSTSILGASRRVQRYEQRRDETPPSVRSVAKGAQVAVLPKIGPVWVDGHRLFRPGEKATLPWTEPRVELVSVRPAVVRSAMRAAIGPRGPRRANRAVPQEQAGKA